MLNKSVRVERHTEMSITDTNQKNTHRSNNSEKKIDFKHTMFSVTAVFHNENGQ